MPVIASSNMNAPTDCQRKDEKECLGLHTIHQTSKFLSGVGSLPESECFHFHCLIYARQEVLRKGMLGAAVAVLPEHTLTTTTKTIDGWSIDEVRQYSDAISRPRLHEPSIQMPSACSHSTSGCVLTALN